MNRRDLPFIYQFELISFDVMRMQHFARGLRMRGARACEAAFLSGLRRFAVVLGILLLLAQRVLPFLM